jgi:thiol-disulfide isomerase/thioredoxin
MLAGLLIARLGLAAVFGVAAAGKLRDRAGTRRAVAAFGVADRLVAPVATLLPVAELAVAVGLIPARSAPWGAAFALLLLAVFAAGIGLNLAQGRAPECHCFGQVHSGPAGWSTLARNAVLAGIAAAVVTHGLVPVVPALALAAAMLAMQRRKARGAGPPEGLAIGSPAPSFALPDASAGVTVTLASLRARRKPILLVFTDPGCAPCSAMAPLLADWQRAYENDVTIALLARGGMDRNIALADEHGLARVLVEDESEVADRYGAAGTPAAVLVGADGRIAGRVAVGNAAIEELLSPIVAARPDGDPGPGLVRREALVRLAAAWAAATGAMASGGLVGNVLAARRCKSDEKRCGTKCCPPTFVCDRRRPSRPRCACPPGKVVCRGRCVRLRTSPSNCGTCGNECPEGTACLYGACVAGDGSGTGPGGTGTCRCPAGRACCQGRCTDLNADSANCGGCGKTCPPGTSCCEGKCVDRKSDPRNCGHCGTRCPAGQVCGEGRCQASCPAGLTACLGACIDVRGNDFENCGRCGKSCEFLTSASTPACCGGRCVDLDNNPANCGACGRRCPPGCACGRDGRCFGPASNGCSG